MEQQGKKITLNNWWKNLLTGVLATAIGVGMTFEVNNRVEHRKQKEAQRQTAMMAIYDIDDIINQFSKFTVKENALYKVAQYLSTHPEEMETVSMDSLWMTGECLFRHEISSYSWTDNSTKKVFTNSIETMRNIGDITFYDNVLECYSARKEMLDVLLTSSAFRHPLEDSYVLEYRKQVGEANLDDNGMMNQHYMAGMLRQVFQLPEVKLYMRKYPMRVREYQHFLDRLVRINQENKYIMNITDRDMEKYIEDHINKTMPAKPKLIAGSWNTRKDNQRKTFTFRKDHSASVTTDMEFHLSIYIEKENIHVGVQAPLTYTIDGHWELNGDSLQMAFDPQTVQITDFDVDFSSFPRATLARVADSLECTKTEYKETIRKQIQAARWTWAEKVSLGKSGNIMFWETQYFYPWGQSDVTKEQLLRSR